MLNDYFLIRGKNADESRLQRTMKLFENYKIRYLIVGGYAVMKYSEPRFTKENHASDNQAGRYQRVA